MQRLVPITLALLCTARLAAQASSASPSSAADDVPVVLTPFEVSSEGDRGYLSTSSAAASRIGSQLKDITQTISVLNEELINDLAPDGLNDILRYASVVEVPEGGDETYTIRGNSGGVPLTDGFRVPRLFPNDPADVERVEVLAGPASVLYGNVFGIGGVINRVTKRPKFSRQHGLQLRYSNAKEDYRGVIDSTGPLPLFGGKKLAYRLIATAQDGKKEMDHSFFRRYMVRGKLLYQFNPSTSLVLEAAIAKVWSSEGNTLGRSWDYILYRTAAGNLVSPTTPTTGGVANTPVLINVPDHANPEEDLVQAQVWNRSTTAVFTSKLSPEWALRLAAVATWAPQNWVVPGVVTSIMTDGQRINRGRPQFRHRGVGNYFWQGDVAGKYDFENFKVTIVGGTEYSVDVSQEKYKAAPFTIGAFDFFNPAYTTELPAVETWTPTTRTDTRVFAWAGFAMTEVSFLKDRLRFNGGMRLIDFEQSVRTHLSDGPRKFKGETTPVPKWGALFRLTDDIGLYYGHGRAYQPSTSVNPDGQILPATEGQQDEVGLKVSLLEGRISGSIGAFDLRQVNILENDPDREGYRIPVGEVSTRGFDVTMTISPTNYWQIVGGYSTAKAETTSSIQAANIGLARTGRPKHRWKLWTRYRFHTGPLKGLSLAAGTNYVDTRSIRFATGSAVALTLPSYQLFDAMVSYPWRKNLSFQLNVKNVSDELYYPSGNTTRWKVGQSRIISFTTNYKF